MLRLMTGTAVRAAVRMTSVTTQRYFKIFHGKIEFASTAGKLQQFCESSHVLTRFTNLHQQQLLTTPVLLNNSHSVQPVRNVTKFSLNKGKRKTVKTVLKRFKRLDWGCWIRTYTGRHKRMWKKSAARKRRLRQHVFVNSTQSWLLDKMVTSFWRRPKHYIDDPYAPYHKRDEFFATKRTAFKV